MRPKKRVLCVDANEQTMSQRVMQLTVWGFCAVEASSVKDAIALLKRGSFDLVLLQAPLMGAENLLEKAKAHGVPTLVTSASAAHFAAMEMANVYLVHSQSYPAEIRERARVLSARKRGPRKGFRDRKALHAAETRFACEEQPRKPVKSVEVNSEKKEVAENRQSLAAAG